MKQNKSKNKITFIIFIISVILIIVLFTLVITKELKKEKATYEISSSSLVYDENYNNIEIKENGTITKKWNNKYYLETENQTYTLGQFTVAYNPNDYRMYIYGDCYKVYKNGETEKLTKENEIIRTGEETFYKISDRKYLIVSSNIKDKTNSLNTKDYLIVELDKIGNATLMNNEINIKTINEMILECGKFDFDIANEKLIFEKNTIDLKKIGGSTNNYVKKETPQKETETEPQEVKQLTEKDLKKLESEIASKIKDNNSAINNRFGNTADTMATTITDITATVNTVTDQVISQKNYYKTVKLLSIASGVNYLDVNYYISDPKNEYEQVFLKVEDSKGNINTYNIDKGNTTYKIIDLVPNQEYTVSLCYNYSMLSELGTIQKEEVADVIKYKTHNPDYKLSITKITRNKIYFKFQADPTYTIESGIIALYVDGQKIGEREINVSESIRENGFTSFIEYQDSGNIVVLKLENPIYNEEITDLDVQAKFIN